jgi:hypothetical protein
VPPARAIDLDVDAQTQHRPHQNDDRQDDHAVERRLDRHRFNDVPSYQKLESQQERAAEKGAQAAVRVDRPFLAQEVLAAKDNAQQRAERDDDDTREVDDFANDEDDFLGLHGFHDSGSLSPPDASS